MGCSSYSAYRKTPTGKALKLNPRKNKKGEIVDYDCKQPEYFNCKYSNNQGNGNFESGDGFKYRGSGLIQITFRDTYKNFTTKYNQRNPDDIKDFEANPELVRTKVKYAVASACDYWRNKSGGGKSNLNLHADEGATDEVVLKIGAVVNRYHPINMNNYNKLLESDKNKYKKAGDDLYLKKPNGYDDRINKFHKLKEHMGL